MVMRLDSASRRGSALRRHRVSIAILGVTIAAIAGILVYFQYVSEARLRAAIAEADRDDPNWRLADLEAHRRVVPIEENSATTVREALQEIGNWPTASSTPPGEDRRGPLRGADLYQAVLAAEIDAALPPELVKALRDELAGLDRGLVRARALAEMGEGRAPVPYDRVMINTLLTHTQQARNVARLLQLDAIARAHDEPDRALDDCRAMLGVARSIGDEPFLISQLVRIAVDGVALATIEQVLSNGVASDASLARVEEALAKEAEHPFVLIGLRGERASTFDMMDKLRRGEISPAQIGGGGGAATMSLLGSLYRFGSFGTTNQTFLLEMLNRSVAISRRPIREQGPLWKDWEEALKPKGSWSKLTTIFASAMMPAVRACVEAGVRGRGQIQAARVMVACERYRLAEGRWPDRVEELSPRFLPAIPEDPYIDKPIKLARREDGRTAYNVGPDRIDDGGWRDPKNRGVTYTDLGYRLLDPDRRHRSPAELPESLFPTGADPIPRDREGRRRRVTEEDLRKGNPELPGSPSPKGDRGTRIDRDPGASP